MLPYMGAVHMSGPRLVGASSKGLRDFLGFAIAKAG